MIFKSIFSTAICFSLKALVILICLFFSSPIQSQDFNWKIFFDTDGVSFLKYRSIHLNKRSNLQLLECKALTITKAEYSDFVLQLTELVNKNENCFRLLNEFSDCKFPKNKFLSHQYLVQHIGSYTSLFVMKTDAIHMQTGDYDIYTFEIFFQLVDLGNGSVEIVASIKILCEDKRIPPSISIFFPETIQYTLSTIRKFNNQFIYI